MIKYLFFDLDNTLCESRQELTSEMLLELGRLSKRYGIIIVSGAEFSRMLIQAPLKYKTFLSQNGNEAYENDILLWENKMDNKTEIREHIEKLAKEMKIKIHDDMVDDRGAQISFSFIGHHAPRDIKSKFDPDRKIRARLLEKYPFQGALIGGTTCIDYVPQTKGQNILKYILLKSIKPQECLYIGDAFMNYGNDATVLGILPVHQVKSHLETLNFIQGL